MRLNFEKRIIVHVLSFCAIIIIIGAAIIGPTIIYIRNLNNDTSKLREYLERRYENTKNMRFSRQKTAEIKDEVQNFPILSFKKTDQLQLITTLENVAGRHNMAQKIENLNLDDDDHLLTLSLTSIGHYEDSWRYLEDLEKINYFLQVDKLSWSPILNNGEQSSSTKMSLDLKLYVNE